ncbi:pentapeptide repeat-containing protein [Clostridium uliginosum]|uniref:Pentapeptide repeat-containing protein n=1 Tax=Clostridium uliginosum TaxID=119641 RepID=A0A1I1N6S1_9CLOT|nr:pentapeptide repeat-containing protein [Clostridium uliginosum]SFC91168.1 Pentapeptide repeat-containing protein [Clostridium uliginosum]
MAINRSAPESFNYNNTDKKDKNFMYKNLKRSNCYNCDFSTSNFDYASFRGAHFKRCSFMKCTFKGAEFIGTNLKGSKFKNAIFENTIFEGVNLNGADFKDAEFKNTVFVATDIDKIRNLDVEDTNIRIFDEMPQLEISDELRDATINVMDNIYIKKSRIFDTKDGDINTLTLMILLENFDEEYLIKGLNMIKSEIDRDFHTLSYIIRLMQNIK